MNGGYPSEAAATWEGARRQHVEHGSPKSCKDVRAEFRALVDGAAVAVKCGGVGFVVGGEGVATRRKGTELSTSDTANISANEHDNSKTR